MFFRKKKNESAESSSSVATLTRPESRATTTTPIAPRARSTNGVSAAPAEAAAASNSTTYPPETAHAGSHHNGQRPGGHHADALPALDHDNPAAPRRRRSRGGRGRRGAGATESTTTTVASPSSPATGPQRRSTSSSLPPALAPISQAFADLGVDETGLEAIAALGYDEPTPIQAGALGLLLDGEDVVGLAQTGTGKTIAFGLPLARAIDPEVNAVQAVVLVPTRELAKQVRDVIDHLGKFYGFATLGLIGGGRVQSDLIALERGTHVVVGTPGRIIDHIKRGTLSLREVRFAVLDEADQMLDIGFARDIDYILRVTPKERQTALFSATMPESIGRIVYRYMRNAQRVAVAPEQKTVAGVHQYFCEVPDREKILALRYLYEDRSLGRSLIFRRTKIGVDRLTSALQQAGVPAQAIHGDLRQGQRDRVMADFRSGALDFLVATNVAARGLDIPDIDNVINYDVPQNAEEYIHRIGRTARAGKEGAAFTFVSEWEIGEWDVILHAVGDDHVEHLRMPQTWD